MWHDFNNTQTVDSTRDKKEFYINFCSGLEQFYDPNILADLDSCIWQLLFDIFIYFYFINFYF